MSLIKVDLDASEIIELAHKLPEAVQEALAKAAEFLSLEMHARITERVNAQLKSRRGIYLDNLHITQESDLTWLIVLDEPALWIEEGLEEHEMIDNLLGGQGVKTALDGSKYRAIPFHHTGLPSAITPEQQNLQNAIKKQLKRAKNELTGTRGIPYKKIERDPSGMPYTGRLHRLNVNTPIKTAHGPGQGWGAIGRPRQGPTGIPFLKGVSIHQKLLKGPDGKPLMDSEGMPQARRDILTFRTVSSKHKGTGRWVHPGLEAKNFMDEAVDWAEDEWKNKIRDQILADLIRKL